MMTPIHGSSRGTRTSGFTLVEMLTVIGILAILLAIIIPVLGKARDAARRSDTVIQTNQLSDACLQFTQDSKRNPGYFNANIMGDMQNADTYGFTNMQNVMLDLLGGITKQAANPAANIITVGPAGTPAGQVVVDLGAIGTSSINSKGGYLTVDSKRYQAQLVANKNKAVSGHNNELLPELLDAFGQPILAWVKNDLDTGTDFAAMNSSTVGAKFYWAPNATLLRAEAVGKRLENQRYELTNSGTKAGSLLNDTAPNSAANIVATMTAMLGNPNAPDTSVTPVRPASARGSIVFHSAGANGVYVGVPERGGIRGIVNYTAGQDPFSGGAFDDVFASSGQ